MRNYDVMNFITYNNDCVLSSLYNASVVNNELRTPSLYNNDCVLRSLYNASVVNNELRTPSLYCNEIHYSVMSVYTIHYTTLALLIMNCIHTHYHHNVTQ